jgi:hypothetical protein
MKTPSATTEPAVNGAELLRICHYDHLQVAIIIATQDDRWRELLDSIPPNLRTNIASYVERIRAALGKDHEL